MIFAITPRAEEAAWLRYRLDLAGSGVADIARRLQVARSTVSQVVNGLAHSARIEAEIARVIGYPGWNEMLKTLRAGAA